MSEPDAGDGDTQEEIEDSRSTGGDAQAAATPREREAVAEDDDELFGDDG